MSQAGESWRLCYQKGLQLWCDPEAITSEDYFLRWARSEWITRMLSYAGLKPSANVRVLEAGCGTARHAITLALLGFSVDAFDYNEEALEISRRLIKKIQPKGDCLSLRLYRDSLLNIQSASATYDLVFNQSVLEYFCDENERVRALEEMVKVTRPGGTIAVIVQHTGHPFRRVWEKLGWSGYVNQPPVAIYTPRRLAQVLKEAGLSQVCIDGIYPWNALFQAPWYRRWKWTQSWAGTIQRRLNSYVPLPRILRCCLGVEILGIGRKL